MNCRDYIDGVQNGLAGIKAGDVLANSVLRLNTAVALADWVQAKTPYFDRAALSAAILSKPMSVAHLANGEGELIQTVARLQRGDPIIVVSHQPTLFTYSGVYVQFVLADVIISILRERKSANPVLIYLCLDADDAFDRRIKTAHLPMPSSERGTLPLTMPLRTSLRGRPQCAVPPPDESVLAAWMRQIEGAFANLVGLVPQYREPLLSASTRTRIQMLQLFEDSGAAEQLSFADTAAAVFLIFAQKITKAPIIMVRMTELIRHGWLALQQLLGKWHELQSAVNMRVLALQKIGVSVRSGSIVGTEPAWAICRNCAMREPVNLEQAQVLADEGPDYSIACKQCGASSGGARYPGLMPRVVLEDLLGVLLTDAAVELTYAGSSEHVLIADWTIPELLRLPSPIFTSHPKQVLGGAVEQAALFLRDGVHRETALRSLQAAVNGRDPFLHSLADVSPSEHASAWTAHFRHEHISVPMILRNTDTCRSVKKAGILT